MKYIKSFEAYKNDKEHDLKSEGDENGESTDMEDVKKEKKKDLDQLKSVLKANTKSNEHEGMNSLRARKEEIEEEENED